MATYLKIDNFDGYVHKNSCEYLLNPNKADINFY